MGPTGVAGILFKVTGNKWDSGCVWQVAVDMAQAGPFHPSCPRLLLHFVSQETTGLFLPPISLSGALAKYLTTLQFPIAVLCQRVIAC